MIDNWTGGIMKKSLIIFIMISLIFFIGCYMIPTKILSIHDITISLPFGDTTVTILDVALMDTEHIELSSDSDTVYVKTKLRVRDNIPTIPAGSLRISINIEELLPEDIIDLDSTIFNSSIDRIINYVRGWGTFNDTASGRIHHMITNRNDDTIYTNDVNIVIPPGTYTQSSPFMFILNVDSFPVGDYSHDIDFVIDSNDYTMTRLESYSKMPLNFHLRSDRVVILMRDQGMISPPDSTPLDLINSVYLNLDIRNRIPLGARLIFAIYNKPGERVLIDTFNIELPPVDNDGQTVGEEGLYNFSLLLDTTLYELFVYDTAMYKARLEIPVTLDQNGDTVEKAYVKPSDYMSVGGYVILNFDIDNNALSDSNKIF